MRFMPLQVSSEDVVMNLKTFSAGSSGGPDGLTVQHLSDLLAGAPDEQFKTNLTDFVNVVLQGDLPTEAREVLFGGRLIALQKKDGGVRLIAVGCTLRRLTSSSAEAKNYNLYSWGLECREERRRRYLPCDVVFQRCQTTMSLSSWTSQTPTTP